MIQTPPRLQFHQEPDSVLARKEAKAIAALLAFSSLVMGGLVTWLGPIGIIPAGFIIVPAPTIIGLCWDSKKGGV